MNEVEGRRDVTTHITWEVFLPGSRLNLSGEKWYLVILISTSHCKFVFPSCEGLQLSFDHYNTLILSMSSQVRLPQLKAWFHHILPG